MNVNIVIGGASREVVAPSSPAAGSVGAAAQQGSLEVAIGKMDKGIGDMQTQIENLTTQMLDAMNSPDPEVKATAEGLKSQISMLNLKLQSVMELRKEMFQLLSNLWKSYHDMSLHAIGNIR